MSRVLACAVAVLMSVSALAAEGRYAFKGNFKMADKSEHYIFEGEISELDSGKVLGSVRVVGKVGQVATGISENEAEKIRVTFNASLKADGSGEAQVAVAKDRVVVSHQAIILHLQK